MSLVLFVVEYIYLWYETGSHEEEVGKSERRIVNTIHSSLSTQSAANKQHT